MRKGVDHCLYLSAVILLPSLAHAAAAELRLRAQCNPAGPVVTLGDVAEIDSADARQAASLAAIELFPAPAAAEQRIVHVREIQDLLLLRGVNLTEHRFSGSSEVTVQAVVARPARCGQQAGSGGRDAADQAPRLRGPGQVPFRARRGRPQTWSVEFELTDAQARALRRPGASDRRRRGLYALDRLAEVRSRRRGTRRSRPTWRSRPASASLPPWSWPCIRWPAAR